MDSSFQTSPLPKNISPLKFKRDVTDPHALGTAPDDRGSALNAALQAAAAQHATSPAPQALTKTGAQTVEPAQNQLELLAAAQNAGAVAADAQAMDELVASQEKLTVVAAKESGRFVVTAGGQSYDLAIDKSGQEMLKYANSQQVAFTPMPHAPENAIEPLVVAPSASAAPIQFRKPIDQAEAIRMGQAITHAEAGSDLAKTVERTLLGQKDGDGKLDDKEMMAAVQRLQMTGKLTELAEAMKGLKDAGVQTAAPAEQPKGMEIAQHNSSLPNFVVVSANQGVTV